MRLLPLLFATALLCGCVSASKKEARRAAKEAEQARVENARAVEQRRMLAIERGEVSSHRGAEIAVADPDKTFDVNGTPGFGSRGFQTTGSRVKEYQYAQRASTGTFRTKDFADARSARVAEKKYATNDARTNSYGGPNAGKAYDTPSAPTREARESGRTAAVRALPGGDRPYLGPEAKKKDLALDPSNLPREYSEFRELKTIDDVRELLNKNK